MLFELLPLILMFSFYAGLFVLLIYFVINRIEDKSKENFEKRDN